MAGRATVTAEDHPDHAVAHHGHRRRAIAPPRPAAAMLDDRHTRRPLRPESLDRVGDLLVHPRIMRMTRGPRIDAIPAAATESDPANRCAIATPSPKAGRCLEVGDDPRVFGSLSSDAAVPSPQRCRGGAEHVTPLRNQLLKVARGGRSLPIGLRGRHPRFRLMNFQSQLKGKPLGGGENVEPAEP